MMSPVAGTESYHSRRRNSAELRNKTASSITVGFNKIRGGAGSSKPSSTQPQNMTKPNSCERFEGAGAIAIVPASSQNSKT